MKNNIIENDEVQLKKIATAILTCYGLDKVLSNHSLLIDDDEITAWYIEGLSSHDLKSENLSDEELIELYNLAI